MCIRDRYPPPPKLVCNVSNCAVGMHAGTVRGVVEVPTQSEPELRAAVAKGPVAVSVWAGALQFYHKGVLEGECMPGQYGNHAMLVVGFGDDAGVPYWKIKNSYGTDFGEDGYLRIRRNDSKCGKTGGIGVLAAPVYPQI